MEMKLNTHFYTESLAKGRSLGDKTVAPISLPKLSARMFRIEEISIWEGLQWLTT